MLVNVTLLALVVDCDAGIVASPIRINSTVPVVCPTAMRSG